MPRKDANPGKHEAAAERRVKALDLRKRGASYRAIGAQLHVSEAQAHRDVAAALGALAKLEHASAAEYRSMELERLDLALLALAPKLAAGDPQIVNAWVRVSESRRRLLGLDQPIALGVEHSMSPAYLALRSVVLQALPIEQRLLLAEALDQVIDADTSDDDEGSATGA